MRPDFFVKSRANRAPLARSIIWARQDFVSAIVDTSSVRGIAKTCMQPGLPDRFPAVDGGARAYGVIVVLKGVGAL